MSDYSQHPMSGSSNVILEIKIKELEKHIIVQDEKFRNLVGRIETLEKYCKETQNSLEQIVVVLEKVTSFLPEKCFLPEK